MFAWLSTRLTPPVRLSLNSFEGQVPAHGEGRLRLTTEPGDEYVFYVKYNHTSNVYDCLIEAQPGYRNRPAEIHNTHRLPADRGGLRICFSQGKEPRTLASAIALSQAWAELTSLYIRNGIPWD